MHLPCSTGLLIERYWTTMEMGIHFIDFLPGAQTARAAERAGAAMFTLADHFF
jgi:hypothetical protein